MPSVPFSRVASHSSRSAALSAKAMSGERSVRGGLHARVPGLEPRATCVPRQLAQVLALDQQGIVEAHMGRELLHLLPGDALAVEPLLQIVEGRNLAAAHDQQLAVEHSIEVEPADDVGKAVR